MPSRASYGSTSGRYWSDTNSILASQSSTIFSNASAAAMVESGTTPYWAGIRLQSAGATLVRDADPVALPKACKNAVELEGIRAAHRRDGAAVSKFLAWLGRARLRAEDAQIRAKADEVLPVLDRCARLVQQARS